MTEKLKLRPLTEGLGAEVTGYEFDSVPSDKTVCWLHQALVSCHLLLFRGRILDSASQSAFTQLFGSRAPSPYACECEADGLANAGPAWHVDGGFLEEPPAISVHHIVTAADNHDTLFTNLASAYERLSPEGRRQASRMRTRWETGVTHPLVLPHPITGRLGLYVKLDGNAPIIDEFGHENRAMRDALECHLCADGTYYRHQWQAGDMLVVDNFAIARRATTRLSPAGPSMVHRTAVHRPIVWLQDSASAGFSAGHG